MTQNLEKDGNLSKQCEVQNDKKLAIECSVTKLFDGYEVILMFCSGSR